MATTKRSKVPKPSEDAVYKELAVMFRVCYPTVVYRFDFGAGAFLSNNYRLMNLQKAIQMHEWAHPDLTIYEPAILDGELKHGLCLEIKRSGERLKTREGNWASPHIEQQAAALERLTEKGYQAQFVVGIIEAQKVIDEYLAAARVERRASIRF